VPSTVCGANALLFCHWGDFPVVMKEEMAEDMFPKRTGATRNGTVHPKEQF